MKFSCYLLLFSRNSETCFLVFSVFRIRRLFYHLNVTTRRTLEMWKDVSGSLILSHAGHIHLISPERVSVVEKLVNASKLVTKRLGAFRWRGPSRGETCGCALCAMQRSMERNPSIFSKVSVGVNRQMAKQPPCLLTQKY